MKVDAQIAEQGKLLRLVLFCIFVPFAITIVILATLKFQMAATLCGLFFGINVILRFLLMPLFVGRHRKRTVQALESMLGKIRTPE